MSSQNGNRSPRESFIFSIFTVLFMLYWTASAIKSGAPIIFWAFGLLGLYTTVRGAINQYRKLKNSKNGGQYSQYTDYRSAGGTDPWDRNFRSDVQQDADGYITESYPVPGTSANFCPYCGSQVKSDHDFCKNCGRQLPD